MKENQVKFIPLLFGADINVYSMARAFHEEYGIVSYAFGKVMAGPCSDSKIIHYTADPNLDHEVVFLSYVNDFAGAHREAKILVIGCGDNYVELISQIKDKFVANVIAQYIDYELMSELIHKEKFYQMCEKYQIDYPATFVHHKEDGSDFSLPFDGPFIVKPSNSVAYWQFPFGTQKKAYTLQTRQEVDEVLGQIYGAGYPDTVIIQDFIPGDDTYMRVLTNYSNGEGEVKMMCLGHVLLEEHTPHGIGNHAVIITEENPELMERFKSFLEAIHYIGYSNFDIKYDSRDGKYKVFELNARQGRSNYYVSGAGACVPKYLVEDAVFHNPLELFYVTKRNLWTVVPHKVAFQYIKPKNYQDEMRGLISEGKVVNPLFYGPDNGAKHKLKLYKSQLGHHVKFKKYLGKK